MKIATKTLAAFDEALEKDQGEAYRLALKELLPKMEDAYRANEKPFRFHLGASLIGRDCSRELWYNYRWALPKRLGARLIRLFNRGHIEEARFLALLKIIGAEVWFETEDGGQFKFTDVDGHFGSALDGVVKNIPDLPKDEAACVEFKTANDKSFQKTKKDGLRSTKLEHFTQMQIYMFKMDLKYGLYAVVNKNDDEIYAEIITLDSALAKRYIDRAAGIIFSDEAPPRIHPSPGWWQCKFCSYLPVCKGKVVPEINCRTCAHSTPSEGGLWSCAINQPEINQEAVYTGCGQHVFNPHLLNGITFHGGNDNCADVTLPNGQRILQGPNHVTSKELKAMGL